MQTEVPREQVAIWLGELEGAASVEIVEDPAGATPEEPQERLPAGLDNDGWRIH